MVPPSPSTSPPPTESVEPVHSFVPRPFPPPALAGIPLEYIIDSLRKLAPRYWNNTESADCSIIYPLDNRPLGLTATITTTTTHESASRVPRTEVLSSSHDPSGMGRRLTAPSLHREDVRMLMKLHIDYLSAQSTLLRALFSGTSPLDLIHPATQPVPRAAARPSISAASVASRLPRLLPSAPDHPIVFLPVPDPSSFPYLVSWMYFGDTGTLEDALQRHAIRWDGLARNVEYLGMPEELKRFLGRWYRRWLQSAQTQQPGDTREDDETDDAPRGRSPSRENSTSPH
ncbi:hypothetical protein F5148DRAFT_120614 [Russula earlei]|uniref:Uncharacterized protein n=1 Tax=Russula earlei TaxID=71964 RepID=A0ACC0U6Y9_9AGAM|nr:hypothetical protein F5148DRAFT_120614 [Russula earlei]